jgi:hypothetical protein
VEWHPNAIKGETHNRVTFWIYASLPVYMVGLGVLFLVTGQGVAAATLPFVIGGVFVPLVFLLAGEQGKERRAIPARIQFGSDFMAAEFVDSQASDGTRVETVPFERVSLIRDENRSRAYTPGRVSYMPQGVPLPPPDLTRRARRAAGEQSVFLNQDNLERFRTEYYVWKRDKRTLPAPSGTAPGFLGST